ncbi:conserved exported hypothetical protein [Xenorhabdus nematophila F1]|nr:hypothetical protein [Xenorhabdus nematophila]CCW31237.1 conserved exported hypothetical protein [Xenorhabdus nematophila F1]
MSTWLIYALLSALTPAFVTIFGKQEVTSNKHGHYMLLNTFRISMAA